LLNTSLVAQWHYSVNPMRTCVRIPSLPQLPYWCKLYLKVSLNIIKIK
jgi:hypothetical protein